MNPSVTVHADPAGPAVTLHVVIGGPGVQSTTILELWRPGQPLQPVTPPNPGSQITVPIPIPASALPGCAIACQVTLVGVAANAPWAVAFMAYQGALMLGSTTDHGIQSAGVGISTTWISFQ